MTTTDTPPEERTAAAAGRPRRRPGIWVLVAVLLTLLLLAIIVLPQLRIVTAAFSDGHGGATLAHFGEFFTTARFTEALWHSVLVSLVAGLLSCLVGIPAAYLLAQYDLPRRGLFLTLATMATVSPPFLGAYAWVMLLGRGGILTDVLPLPFDTIIGPGGIIWVTIWATQSMTFLIAYDTFRSIDPSLDEAAASVGSNPWRTRLRIVLPLAVPALVTGFYTAAMKIFADFGTPLIIGGGFRMLPVQVYNEFLSEVSTNPALASSASLVMLAVAGATLAVQQWALRRRTYASVGVRTRPLQPVGRTKKLLMTGWLCLVFLLSFVPHLVVIGTSFLTWQTGILTWTPTLANYRQLFAEDLGTILTSFVLAGIGCVLCILVGVLTAYITVRRRYRVLAPALNIMVMIPYILPGTVLAIGLILSFNSAPLILTGTATIIVLAYLTRRLPYFMKSVEAAMTQVHPALEEAAISVGAKPLRAFRQATLPAIRPAVVSGGTVAFLQMITELSATIMVYAVPFVTMTVVIFNNAVQPGSPFGVASAMTVVLMVSVYVPLYFVRRRFTDLRTS